MALPITVPFTFANATTTQNLSSLDSDFSTVYNAVNGIGNGTVSLSNVSITGGSITANVSITGNITSNTVTYLQGGANSVTTTVQKKLTEFVSIKDFGAVGDGSTDTTAAFTNAVNAVNTAGGGTVWVPAGNYLFKYVSSSPSIRIYSNTHILFEQGATLLNQAVYGGINSCLFWAQNASGISITGPGKIKAAPGITVTASITTGNAVISSISDTSNIVVNMPVDGTGIPATAYVVSKTSNSVTISQNATATNSSATINFRYTGGTMIGMNRVDRLYVGGGLQLLDQYASAAGYSSRLMASATDFIIDGVVLGYDDKTSTVAASYGGEDGIHIISPSYNGVITNITGFCGDDVVILAIEDWSQGGWDSNITNIDVSNIAATSLWAHVFRIYTNVSSTTGVIQYINANNITGTVNSLGGNAGTNGLPLNDNSSRSAIKDVFISNVNLYCGNVGLSGLNATYCKNLTLNNFQFASPYNYNCYVSNCYNVVFNNIDCSVANRTANPGVYVLSTTNFNINGGYISNQGSHGVYLGNVTTGSISYVSITVDSGNGIALTGNTSHFRIVGNYLAGDAGPAVQEYNTANYNIVSLNDKSLNTGGGISIIGANSISVNNI
jgi:polygalacturonase